MTDDEMIDKALEEAGAEVNDINRSRGQAYLADLRTAKFQEALKRLLEEQSKLSGGLT